VSRCNTVLCAQVCHHKFVWQAIYAPNTPSKLGVLDLISGLAVKCKACLSVALRLFLVVLVWLGAVPLLTCWTWKLGFVRTPSQVSR
jgi:E3 ubiquitin-protein ligase DOA10